MKTNAIASIIIICLTLIGGCQKAIQSSSVDGLEFKTDQQLVNYARPKHGTEIFVSENNYDRPAETLTNGVISTKNWDSGEGWESYFDGPYEFAKYASYGNRSDDAKRLAEQMRKAVSQGRKAESRNNVNSYLARTVPSYFDDNDYRSMGLTRLIAKTMIPTAMGWVVFEFPEERMVTRVVIYTVDSERYPAKDYGVKDLTLQYWTPQGWTNVDKHVKKPGEQHYTVMNNKQGRIVIHFQPVLTSRIRLVIRYTNDTEIYGRGQRGGRTEQGYYRHIRGTIRLTEVEIYGFADGTSEQELDGIFEGQPTTPVTTHPQTQIERVVRAYESAYRNRDLSALMTTVSPNYSRDGENYEQLRAKLEGLFQTYAQIDFSTQRLRIKPSGAKAKAESDYLIKNVYAIHPTKIWKNELNLRWQSRLDR